MRVDPPAPQHTLKRVHILVSRSLERQTLDRVVANQVDVASEGCCYISELPCMMTAIIDASEQQVLQSNLAPCRFEEIASGREDLADRCVLCPRN